MVILSYGGLSVQVDASDFFGSGGCDDGAVSMSGRYGSVTRIVSAFLEGADVIREGIRDKGSYDIGIGEQFVEVVGVGDGSNVSGLCSKTGEWREVCSKPLQRGGGVVGLLHDGGSARCLVGEDDSGNGAPLLGERQASGSCGLGDSNRFGVVGGPNLERNRENRRLKRERKLKRQSMNQDWRKRDKSTADSGVSVGGNQGFWNSCSPEVRQQLIDSKAEWHIAENKRRAREEVAKLEKSTSVQAVVKQVLDTVKLANELKKNTKDEKIGGWAETVADSLNKSVAESVPSSLPSLESVGYGEAAIGRGGLSTPQTSNSEYDEVCQKLADKESICEKLNLRISELETKQLVSDGEMKKVLENEKNVEKRLFEAEIDKIKLRHYSSDIFCDDFLQRDIDMFTRDYKKKQQQKKKNKGS